MVSTANDIERARAAAHEAFRRGDAAAGIAAYQRVLELAPEDADAHAQLAHAFERRHDLKIAKTHAHTAIAANRDSSIARVALGRVFVREERYADAERVVMPIVKAEHASANDRAVAWGVIGDARDLAGDAPGAFAAFTAANQLHLQKHAALRDDAAQLLHPAGVAAMTQFVRQTDVSKWRRPDALLGEAPVFLVGFPRSGTTLLDQILSSHSRIVCLEEKEYLAVALAAVFKDAGALASMGTLSDGEIGVVRSIYWRNVGAELADVVVDKMPLNVIVLPLIKALFPDSKIIVALRDPRDVVLSCYQQRFGMNAAMAQLLEIGRAGAYYDLVMSLLDICLRKLDLQAHQVRYEDVVADIERESRALAAFVGLDFEPAMLEFHKTARGRQIATPSARQVIQPLYARSIGRWRRYAEDLAPVLPQLNA